MSSLLRLLVIGLALSCGGINLRAGVASYTDRKTIDFDTALHLLNPYGTWSKIDGTWAYTPLDHEAPYTNGRWLYTEYGWYWKGNHAHSWITEHYGFWKRGDDKVWSWFPGAYWLSEIVEFRATPTHIGWRSGEVDREGNFVEAPDDRYAKTDEWTFVTKAQFANPITPGMIVKPAEAATMLEDSTDCNHAYMSYRPLDRPGPHPADFVALCKDGGMFSPLQTQQIEVPPSVTQTAPPPSPLISPSTNAPAATAPSGMASTGRVKPALTINGTGDDAEQVDKRQVKYWVTMSLPTYWTPRPPEAKPEELYMYRPDFYQDTDGIARRVTVWFNPKAKTSMKEVLAETMVRPKADPDAAPAAAAPAAKASAQPATPAVSAKPSHDPFRSPLDAPYQPSHSSSSSSKNPSQSTPAPDGLVNPSNAAPTK